MKPLFAYHFRYEANMKKLLLAVIIVIPFCFTPLLARAIMQTPPSAASAVQVTSGSVADAINSNLSPQNKTLYDILFTYLALSIIFEVAMHPIFNWKYFLIKLDGKGLKTPITVITAFVVFKSYDVDIIRDILNAQNNAGSANHSFAEGGKLLTALLIAGGSSGILQIFTKLGIRPPEEERAQKVQKLKADAAAADAAKTVAKKDGA